MSVSGIDLENARHHSFAALNESLLKTSIDNLRTFASLLSESVSVFVTTLFLRNCLPLFIRLLVFLVEHL